MDFCKSVDMACAVFGAAHEMRATLTENEISKAKAVANKTWSLFGKHELNRRQSGSFIHDPLACVSWLIHA